MNVFSVNFSWENARFFLCFFFQAEDGIRDADVTGVQTCALPIWFQRRNSSIFPVNTSSIISSLAVLTNPLAPIQNRFPDIPPMSFIGLEDSCKASI